MNIDQAIAVLNGPVPYDMPASECVAQCSEATAVIVGEVERLQTALRHYADESNWSMQDEVGHLCDLYLGGDDGWSVAQKALNETIGEHSP